MHIEIFRKGRSERAIFGGKTFYRYPEAKSRSMRVYFQATDGERLHQAVYRHFHGPIPEGQHVHHKDADTLNNDPTNLELMTPSAHAVTHVSDEHHERLRAAGRQRFQGFQAEHIDWRNNTPEGREWKRKQNQKMIAAREAKRERVAFVCAECGNEAVRPKTARGELPKYCSGACNSRAFRKRRKKAADAC